MSEEKYLRLAELERSRGNKQGELEALQGLKAFRQRALPQNVTQTQQGPQDIMSLRAQAFGLEPLPAPQITSQQGFVQPSQVAEFAKGIPGAIPAIASGIIAEPIAGIVGGAEALNPLTKPGAGARAVETVRNALTIEPIGPAAKKTLGQFGQALSPLAEIPRGAGEFAESLGAPPIVSTAIETGVAAIPEAIGLKGGRALKGPNVKRVSIEPPELVQEAQRAARETGIDLFEAQQTLSQPLLERQSFVQQLPAGVKKASKALEIQNEQASKAVDNILNAIASDESIIQGPERLRSAAQRAIELKKKIRSERSSPIYQQAFSDARKKGLNVDTSDIVNEFQDIAETFPEKGSIRSTINKAISYLDSNDLQRLHNAKLEIDELISGRGDNAIGNTSKRQLVDLKTKLVDRMAEASPEYERARAQFEADSPPVTQIENSIIGKIADLDDTQLKSVSSAIFDPAETNPSIVKNAKEIISEVDPEAWNMIVRNEIERRLGSIKPDIGGSIENIPGKMANAIFGIGKKRNALLAGAPTEARNALLSLETALKRAGQGRTRGSQTAGREEIKRELRGGVVSSLRDLFKQPLDTIIRTGEDAQFDKRVSAMSEALFNPKWQPETSRLIKTNKGKELSRLILSIEALKESSRQGTEEQPQSQR